MASDAGLPSASDSPGWGAMLLNTLLVVASFLAFSLVQAPIPGPNEPHYLCKAKHYWDPEFCAGDLFLESADAHVVFFQTVGLLTRILSLEQTALLGRIIGYALLAFGWTRLIARLSPARFAPLWTAWVFLGIAAFGNLSGEWIVGGIESKVFAYGFLLWGMAEIADARWMRAGILGGLAISFHPVVGCWGAIAAGMATAAVWGLRWWRRSEVGGQKSEVRGQRSEVGSQRSEVRGQRSEVGGQRSEVRGQRSEVGGQKSEVSDRSLANTLNSQPSALNPQPRQLALAVGLLIVFALPGVIPAVGLLTASDNVETEKADRIQIFERLPHHLDPLRFKKTQLGDYELHAAWIGYGFLFVFWLILHRRQSQRRQSPPRQSPPVAPGGTQFIHWFGWFVIATTLIAAVGFFIGDMQRLANGHPHPEAVLLPLRIKLMKLYPFRLFDVMLPIATAVVVVNALRQSDSVVFRSAESRPFAERKATMWRAELMNGLLFAGFFAFSIVQPIADRNPSHMRPGESRAWLETCRWVDANLPADAQVRTPHSSWAFKWYARRAEYFSNKDCPQDAKGILEWKRRAEYLDRWYDEKWDNGYSKAALAELHKKENITHFIVYSRYAPAIDLQPIYPPDPGRKSGFHVYRLRDAVSR